MCTAAGGAARPASPPPPPTPKEVRLCCEVCRADERWLAFQRLDRRAGASQRQGAHCALLPSHPLAQLTREGEIDSRPALILLVTVV